MPHWRVIEATGSSAERRITQPGHSPIAGATQDIRAIEEASSPWADTGLAQGARPLSQRTGPASSATAYKDAPDAKSAFFSSAIHRVLPSRFSSRKRLLRFYSMAPSKKTASSKGKTRMYLCPACEHRHVPPTGIRCPHVQQPRSTPLEASARSQRLASRRARTPSSDENDDYLRCSGRTRRSLRPSTGPGSSSEDEHSQDMFVTQPTTSEGRSAHPEEAPALPPVRSTPPVPPPRSSLFRPAVQPLQPDVATMLLEQMRQMQAQNQREFARLGQQGAADRLALREAIQTFAARPE